MKSVGSFLTEQKSLDFKQYQEKWLAEMKAIANERQPFNYLKSNNINIDKPICLSDFVNVTPNFRVIPNDFARSSLFFVKKKGTPRKSMNREKIFHISDNVEVRYTGEELRADDDELVWLALVHHCIRKPLGDAVDVKVSDLLKDLGWAPKGDNYKRIRTIISRLKATDVIIKNKATYGDLTNYKKQRNKTPSLTHGLSLISGYIEYDRIDGEPTRYLISIDKMLIFFFCGGLFTYLDWEHYKSLTPSGRRLTDYILSHKDPLPLKVESFLQMTGCDTEQIPVFRQNQQAKRVCDELMKKGIVYSAKVENGQIFVERHA